MQPKNRINESHFYFSSTGLFIHTHIWPQHVSQRLFCVVQRFIKSFRVVNYRLLCVSMSRQADIPMSNLAQAAL